MKKYLAVLPLAALAFAAACSDVNQNPLAAGGGPLFHGQDGPNTKLTKPTVTAPASTGNAVGSVTMRWDASQSVHSHYHVTGYQFSLRKHTTSG